jgi:hypothetical protein
MGNHVPMSEPPSSSSRPDSGPVERAEEWLDEKTMPDGNRPKGLEDAGAVPSVEELRRQQRREISHATLGTQGQTHGAIFGALGGAVVGAIAGLLVGLAFFDGDSPAPLVILIVVALFGSVIGFVYWGGRTPELENETMTSTGRPGSSSTPRDAATDDRGR